mgnify:CR=1 FL=1
MKTLLTDIDDVLLHFAWGFENWLYKNYNFVSEHKLVQTYDLVKWSNMDVKVINNYINEFFNSHDYCCLHPYFDALQVLPKFYKNNWKIIAITAAPKDDFIYIKRKTNLLSCFGDIFDDIILIGSKEDTEKYDKYDVLKTFNTTWYVEDSEKQAKCGLKANHNVLLLNRNHNKTLNHDNLYRINNWYEIEEKLLTN